MHVVQESQGGVAEPQLRLGGVLKNPTHAILAALAHTLRKRFSRSATAPATCGDAIDVPLILPWPPCSSGNVEQMNPPGAPMSGFKLRSGAVPKELKAEIRPPVGIHDSIDLGVHVIVTGPDASRASISSPSACDANRPGS